MNSVETNDKLPAPLTAPECDLRDFRFMPLEVDRLQRSKQWRIAKRRPEIGFYALNLWAASWREVPAASLEDDDDALADAAMCSPENWPAVREDCLRGWIRCSDGRLYHPVVAAKALEAWIEKLERRKRSDAGNSKKYNREFDPKAHDDAIAAAQEMLARVLPGGEAFPNGSRKEPGGSPQGSQGKGREGTGNIREDSSSLRSEESDVGGSARARGPTCSANADAILSAVHHPLLDPIKSAGLIDTALEVDRWIAAGADLDRIVIPTVAAAMQTYNPNKGPVSSWAYFKRRVHANAAADAAPNPKIIPLEQRDGYGTSGDSAGPRLGRLAEVMLSGLGGLRN